MNGLVKVEVVRPAMNVHLGGELLQNGSSPKGGRQGPNKVNRWQRDSGLFFKDCGR